MRSDATWLVASQAQRSVKRVSRSVYIEAVGRVLEFSGGYSTCSDIRNRLHLSSSYCTMEYSSQWSLVSLFLRSNGYLVDSVQRWTTRCAAENHVAVFSSCVLLYTSDDHTSHRSLAESSGHRRLNLFTARKPCGSLSTLTTLQSAHSLARRYVLLRYNCMCGRVYFSTIVCCIV